MIIVSVVGPTMKEAFAQVAQSSPYANAFEFRLDMIHEPPMSLLFSSTKKTIVATCRPVWEGGEFAGGEGDRMEILHAASSVGADFVDIELKTERHLRQEFIDSRKNQKVILSSHLFEWKRIDAAKQYKRMRSVGAEVIKFAYMARDAADMRHAFEFLNLARRDKQNAVAIAMGEFGEASRVLYKRFGGWATFASTEDGKSSAPGQLSASESKYLYCCESISPKTKIFGVIGNPLKQSKGIHLHNPLFHKAKCDAVYCRFPVINARLFMQHVAPMLTGFSVTLPHKQMMLKFVDRVDKPSKAIGAINTVVRKNGKWLATNTDAPGALDAIESKAQVNGKKVLIVGAGGAARAIAYEAKLRGAIIFITNRSDKKAKQLANEFGTFHVRKNQLRANQFDVIVNATSVGMTPKVNQSPLRQSILKNAIVFDAVYNPPVTKLLKDAKRAGATIIQGTEMYVNQAALQSELYSGTKPNRHKMKSILGYK
jgi:3-dehydroquinate dehydratase / shikimate dehydrogenase